MKPFALALLFLLFAFFAKADTNLVQHLRDESMTVRSANSRGSGVAIARTNADGTISHYVWTAAHVVDESRHKKKVLWLFNSCAPAKFDQVIVLHTQFVPVPKDAPTNVVTAIQGRMFQATIIKYSDVEDVALLRIDSTNFYNVNTDFYLKTNPPAVGTDIYHIGSYGTNTYIPGILSFGHYGKPSAYIGNAPYDNVLIEADHGSSGGGVFLADNGQCTGLLLRTQNKASQFIIPMRRMRAWAKRVGVEWALDPSVPMPSKEVLDKMPVE